MSLFRSLVRLLGPGWLVKDELPNGKKIDSRVLYAQSLVFDALAKRVRDGILARYPVPADAKKGKPGAPDDALPLLGRDRMIRRGPLEPRESIIGRLRRARKDHKTRGAAWPLLAQVQGFLAPRPTKVAIVNEHGTFWTRDIDGTETQIEGTSWDWDGADLDDNWARFWVIIYSESGVPFDKSPPLGPSAGTLGTPNKTVGTTATSQEVQGIRRVVDEWAPDGSVCVSIIISFDDAGFAPDSLTLPNGTWGRWRNRNPNGRYWRGTQDL